MEFIVIPREVFNLTSIDRLKELGIDSPRASADGKQVLLHIEHYNSIEEFPSPISTLEDGEIETIQYPYPVYNNPSDELSALLNSDEWTSKEESNI
jgi:hypothetical protein